MMRAMLLPGELLAKKRRQRIAEKTRSIVLRACYALPGADVLSEMRAAEARQKKKVWCYAGAMRCPVLGDVWCYYAGAMRCPILRDVVDTRLCICDAMSGIEIGSCKTLRKAAYCATQLLRNVRY
eukprot:3092374-Rhodomonas_salina.3